MPTSPPGRSGGSWRRSRRTGPGPPAWSPAIAFCPIANGAGIAADPITTCTTGSGIASVARSLRRIHRLAVLMRWSSTSRDKHRGCNRIVMLVASRPDVTRASPAHDRVEFSGSLACAYLAVRACHLPCSANSCRRLVPSGRWVAPGSPSQRLAVPRGSKLLSGPPTLSGCGTWIA